MTYDGLDYEWTFGGRGTIRHWMSGQEAIEIRGNYYGTWDATSS